MKQNLLIIAVLLSIRGFGQVEKLPLKDGNVFYELSDSSALGKNALYVKSLEWLSSAFKNSKFATETQDKDGGLIIAKGNLDIVSGKGFMQYHPNSKFSLKINVKDGKCRIQVYDITIMNAGYYIPIETHIKKYGEKKQQQPFYESFDFHYKSLIDDYIRFTKTKKDDF